MSTGDGAHQVGHARTKSPDADAGCARQLRTGIRHEASGPLVTNQHKVDAHLSEGLDERQQHPTGHAKRMAYSAARQVLRQPNCEGPRHPTLSRSGGLVTG